MKQGTCKKCGKFGNVVMHHAYGYECENKDNVQPYCRACHAMIHIEARKSGKCRIPVKQLRRLSMNSGVRRYHRENRRQINFRETVMTNVRLMENIQVFPNYIMYSTYFEASHNKKLYYINI